CLFAVSACAQTDFSLTSCKTFDFQLSKLTHKTHNIGVVLLAENMKASTGRLKRDKSNLRGRHPMGSIGGILNFQLWPSFRKEEPYDEKPSGNMEEVTEAGNLIRRSILMVRQWENLHGFIIFAIT
ncbi:hypothetical protein X801_02916, partial [Opisthorchis viverrini]